MNRKIGRELTFTQQEVLDALCLHLEKVGLPAPTQQSTGVHFELRNQTATLSWVDDDEVELK